MTHLAGRLLLAAAVTTAAGQVSPARAQSPAGAVHLLDVPFLPQSEALCGGAAVAMVMRYWGATGVYAETFSALVDRDVGGIRGEDLLSDLHARGWDATSIRGDAVLIQRQLAAGRPVIALIEDRPGRYHYVVIVGWAGGRVVLHDPARAPFRVIQEDKFNRAWEPTGFWALLATKRADASSPAETSPPAPADTSRRTDAPCEGMVGEGIRLANAGDLDQARQVLEVAASDCPSSAAPLRELAGLHALRSEWRDAALVARQALARDGRDEQAARILATALYLEGYTQDALAAWNTLGEPRIEIVNIIGLDRTRFAVAAAAAGLDPGELLTPSALALARRRLQALPSVQVSRVDYRPGEAGRAGVDVAVVERPLAPVTIVPLGAIGLRAVTDREIGVTIASPSGGGEAWRASWRWWEHRPRVTIALDAPAPFGGTWGIDAVYDRQTYEASGSRVEEDRRTALFHVSDWTQTGLRWRIAAGVDGWRRMKRGVMAGGAIEQRLFGDRVAVRADGFAWTLEGGVWTAGVGVEWHSSEQRQGSTWLARAGVSAAAARAPLALWAGAGTGQGRDLLLRAHPLLHDGVVREAVFGRRVFDGGVEWRGWRSAGRGVLRVAPAVFIDTARATHGLEDSNDRWQMDTGAGLRLAVPGSGVIRVDLARGVRDGGFVLSAGWTR